VTRSNIETEEDWNPVIQSWKTYAEIAIALLVLLDPLGAVPVFVTLTANHTPEERRRTITVINDN
jgi:small neutral amino acid transporter SnatA (MarC family)